MTAKLYKHHEQPSPWLFYFGLAKNTKKAYYVVIVERFHGIETRSRMEEYMPVVYVVIGAVIVLVIGKVIGDITSRPLSDEEAEQARLKKKAS